MQNKTEIEKLVSLYQLTFPNELETLDPIIGFLHRTTCEKLYDRRNFDGHITASAFVVNKDFSAFLMLYHKKLNRWLQPGGHVDLADADLLTSAIRETVEETGITAKGLTPVEWFTHGAIFDIDSHLIPANTTKDEPSHLHHDCRFLLICDQEERMEVNQQEAHDCKWVPLADLENDTTFKHVVQKIMETVKSNHPPEIADKLV
jgi:8-oxo-dGTP pyrophosphatase MutT (NUDIX family)